MRPQPQRPGRKKEQEQHDGNEGDRPGPCGNAEPWLRDFWGLSPLEVMKGKDREMLEQLEEDEKGALRDLLREMS